jgi:hypothetical protein
MLGFRGDLADVVDGPLDSVLVAFFLSLHHDKYANDLVGSCQVEEHRLKFCWCCQDVCEGEYSLQLL